MRKNSKIYAISLILIGLLASFSSTYAYWQGAINTSNESNNPSINIGSWNFGGSSYIPQAQGIPEFKLSQNYPTDTIVWYDGAYYITRGWENGYPPSLAPYGAYNKITVDFTYGNTYESGDVVYCNGNFYKALDRGLANQNYPGQSLGGWYNMTSIIFNNQQNFYINEFTIYQDVLYYTTSNDPSENVASAPNLNNKWRVAGSMAYDSNVRYVAGDIVYYNGVYFKADWETTGTTPSTSNPYGVWKTITLRTYVSGTTYNTGEIILYGGHQYKVINSALTSTNAPGVTSGIYKQLDTTTYVPKNTYSIGEVVYYNGLYYRVVNQSNAQNNAPGTVKNAWNLVNTAEYQWFNVYASSDYVMHINKMYKVYDVTRANTYAPNTQPNSWNLTNTFEYNQYKVYVPGLITGITIYNGIAYKAVQQTVGNQPPNTTYWALYS